MYSVTVLRSISRFIISRLAGSLWLLGLLVSLTLHAQTVPDDSLPARPSPPRLVNDLVGMLSPSEVQQLERKLVAYNDSTSSQLAIVVVKSTGIYEPADYAFSIGRKWGVGQKGKNNGVVLLWATGTRKIYIATGRGMEGVLPDAIAKRIISQIIAPNFKQQQYYQGLDEAVDEMFRRATGEYKADPAATDDSGGGELFIWMLVIMVIIFFVIRSRGGGGGRGTRYRGGGGMFLPYTTFSGWGSSSGSFGGGGGGGGGGFGGFGGGDFGGGGAGGDY
ncbi:TPM domain-containing protein [Fibrella aestuarina]|uniref:TPM domain-containing protein n=1 Tax=Fibrivirga algicola TaxID=2950420 RepID=A0ABX0QPE4_9BACT|nr:TPM domain-containing protein [Fibrivirga algicola]